MNIYAGNLPYGLKDQDLQALFAEHGDVEKATILIDRETGRSRGFGFVVMPDEGQALAAISALNGHEIDGRALRINEAKPKEERPRFERSGGGRSGGGGRGGQRGGGRRNYNDDY
ncbi:MAG TPA: RNA-binding protein [Leptospiraceae bacterium]|nr:RNA-binding protein [Spirochaetaceae bacterium]HBS06431.1 RNA-binding protein [Leptospiraceae bacterium]